MSEPAACDDIIPSHTCAITAFIQKAMCRLFSQSFLKYPSRELRIRFIALKHDKHYNNITGLRQCRTFIEKKIFTWMYI